METIGINTNTTFNIDFQNINADYERKFVQKEKSKLNRCDNFDQANPDGQYTLDLKEAFN